MKNMNGIYMFLYPISSIHDHVSDGVTASNIATHPLYPRFTRCRVPCTYIYPP
jgi:hypothetical protein